MSSRDPGFDGSYSLSFSGLQSWRPTDGQLTFRTDIFLETADNSASFISQELLARRDAYVSVNLTAGNLYYFWAYTSAFASVTPSLTIHDGDGNLLDSIDGDDLLAGFDGINSDSVVLFAPETSGTYYLNVRYHNTIFTTGYAVQAWEDVGADFINGRRPPPTSVAIAAEPVVHPEGDSSTRLYVFTVTRTGQLSDAQSVGWFIVGSGENPADDADFLDPSRLSGVVDFAAGQQTATIAVEVRGDTLREPTERFEVRLQGVMPGLAITAGTGTGVITNDDFTISLSHAATVTEPEIGGSLLIVSYTLAPGVPSSAPGSWSVTPGDSGASATGADFVGGVLPSGRIRMADGSTSGLLFITIGSDTLMEGPESFTISIWGGSDELLARGSVTILDHVPPPPPAPVWVEAVSWEVQEGTGAASSVTFIVSRADNLDSAGSLKWRVITIDDQELSVDGADFVGGVLPFGSVRFAEGDDAVDITLLLAGDGRFEPDEQFVFELFDASSTLVLETKTAQVTILNDDTQVSVTALAPQLPEGNAGPTNVSFTVFRDGPLDRVQGVNWAAVTADGQAQASDFVGGVLPAGRIVFAVGEASRTIIVPVAGDSLMEPDETLTLQLSLPNNGLSLGTATASARILNDDSRIGFTGAAPTAIEGHAGAARLSFTLAREGALGLAQSVDWVLEGTGPRAVDAADFAGGVMPAGRVTFAAGAATATISVDVAGDTRFEPDELMRLRLHNPDPGVTLGTATAEGSILNDDTGVSVTALSPQLAEGHAGPTSFTFSVTREGPLDRVQGVTWATVLAEGQAQASDFVGSVPPTGRIVFAVGEASRTITVAVAGDSLLEPNESFAVQLSLPNNGLSLGNAMASARILNDDSGVALTARAASRAEGAPGAATNLLFDVTRSGALSAGQTVDWAVVTGGDAPRANALDFVGGALPTGRITFAEGATRATISVAVAGDVTVEGPEQFLVRLSAPSAGLSLGAAEARGTILNDDSTVAIAAPVASLAEGDSGSTAFAFALTRAGATEAAQSVGWSVSGTGGVRASAADFVGGVMPSGRVDFAPGQATAEILVLVAGDTLVERAEQFTVRLLAPTAGLRLDVSRATATITNDDAPAPPVAASIWEF